MAETNTNFQTYNGNIGNYVGRNFSYGDLVGLNNQMGQSAGNQPTFINGGNIYQVKDNGNNTFSLSQIDTVANRQGAAATQAYQAGIGSAEQGLQAGSASLSGKYSTLLDSIVGSQGIYQPLISQATQNAGEQETARGLTPDSALYKNQVQGALAPVYGSEASNVASITQGSISDTNTYANAVANLVAGGAGTAATLPLNYGSLALSMAALPANIFSTQAQGSQALTGARYIPIPNVGVYDTQSKSFVGGGVGASPSALTGVGGLFSYSGG